MCSIGRSCRERPVHPDTKSQIFTIQRNCPGPTKEKQILYHPPLLLLYHPSLLHNQIFFMFNSDPYEPIILYGFRRQTFMVPPSLNDLNLPTNWRNILAAIAVVQPATPQYKKGRPLSTGAVLRFPNFNAANEYQRSRKMRHFFGCDFFHR